MTELEFYYHSDKHPDPYVHKDRLQKSFGKFYVHPKDGYFGGIDLTLGDEGENIFCGVLLRGVKDANNTFISGPNMLKRNVFYENLKVGNYKDLQDIIDEKVKLENDIQKGEEIYHSTRLGLKAKFEDFEHNGKYIYKLHRFIAYNIKNHAYEGKIDAKKYDFP